MPPLVKGSTLVALIVALSMTGASDTGGMTFEPWQVIAEITKQGTLGLLCILVLWSYRRDFYRRTEDKDREIAERKAEKDRLEAVLERNTAAIASSMTATARQTDATHRLARNVEKLEEKFE